jgi:hypothetical protein
LYVKKDYVYRAYTNNMRFAGILAFFLGVAGEWYVDL